MAWNIRVTRTLSPALEILANQVNVDVASSIVLDASAFPLNSDGERELIAGTPLKKSGNQYVPWIAATDLATTLAGILNFNEKVPDLLAHSDVAGAMWNHGQWFRPDRVVGYVGQEIKFKTGLPTCKFSFV